MPGEPDYKKIIEAFHNMNDINEIADYKKKCIYNINDYYQEKINTTSPVNENDLLLAQKQGLGIVLVKSLHDFYHHYYRIVKSIDDIKKFDELDFDKQKILDFEPKLKNDLVKKYYYEWLLLRIFIYTGCSILFHKPPDDEKFKKIKNFLQNRKDYFTVEDIEPKTQISNNDDTEKSKEFTLNRQILAIKYLIEDKNFDRSKVQKTKIISFLKFLTSKSQDNIKKGVGKYFKDEYIQPELSDLKYIRKYFEDLGLGRIVNTIDEDINYISDNIE